MANLSKKAEQLRKAATRVDNLSQIYEEVEDKMKWNIMDYHEPDDEHEEPWFTIPEPQDEYDEYTQRRLDKYEVYQEVLATIEKLATK